MSILDRLTSRPAIGFGLATLLAGLAFGRAIVTAFDQPPLPSSSKTIMIPGPKGDQGPKGNKGDKGDQGPKGIQGIKGDNGIPGPQGDQGIPGIAIQGPAGAKGRAGTPGIQGSKGSNGIASTNGKAGDQGIKGDKGDQGIPGSPAPTPTPIPSSSPSSAFCPVGFIFREIEVHQRQPVDQDLPIWVCIPSDQPTISSAGG